MDRNENTNIQPPIIVNQKTMIKGLLEKSTQILKETARGDIETKGYIENHRIVGYRQTEERSDEKTNEYLNTDHYKTEINTNTPDIPVKLLPSPIPISDYSQYLWFIEGLPLYIRLKYFPCRTNTGHEVRNGFSQVIIKDIIQTVSQHVNKKDISKWIEFVNPNKYRNINTSTILHEMVISFNPKPFHLLMDMLINYNIEYNFNTLNENGDTVLITCIKYGKYEEFLRICEYYSTLNTTSEYSEPNQKIISKKDEYKNLGYTNHHIYKTLFHKSEEQTNKTSIIPHNILINLFMNDFGVKSGNKSALHFAVMNGDLRFINFITSLNK